MSNKRNSLQVGETWKNLHQQKLEKCTSHNLKYGNKTYILHSSMAMHIALSSM
jgi:hypothetical protein